MIALVSTVTFLLKAEKTNSTEGPYSIVQQFEISDPVAKACWYKDGRPIYSQKEMYREPQTCPVQAHSSSANWMLGSGVSGQVVPNVDKKGGDPRCSSKCRV